MRMAKAAEKLKRNCVAALHGCVPQFYINIILIFVMHIFREKAKKNREAALR